MSLLKQIDDRGAVLEWSPFGDRANLVALATKDSAGAGFGQYGGELEIHSVDFAAPGTTITNPALGSVKSNSRFSSLAWSKMSVQSGAYPSGIIAGGMADGHLNVWDAERIMKGDGSDPLIILCEGHHTGSVTGLQFNPHAGWEHSLASGGSDGDVLVTSLERPEAPQTYTTSDSSKHQGEVTKVAWNTGTHYILASADNRGSTCVWDMKQRKMWCEIKDPTGGAVTDIAWGPESGANIATASGDDRNPVIKFWDLRKNCSIPVAKLEGHTEGILSIGWCPFDSTLLMSCGKDNRTIIWDLQNGKPAYELPSEGTSTADMGGGDGGDLFGGVGARSGGKRYQATWSPHMPGVAATCSFDRRVQFHSLTGFKSDLGRAPKWLRRPVGATFGFGGKLAIFNNAPVPGGAKGSAKVQVLQVVEDQPLLDRCESFHKHTAAGTYKALCDDLVASAVSEQDKEVWALMKVICFEVKARELLQNHLGFDSVAIGEAAANYVNGGKAVDVAPEVPALVSAPLSADAGGDSADDFFSATPPATVATVPVRVASPVSSGPTLASLTPEMQNIAAGLAQTVAEGHKAEPMIRQAVIVGNFPAAVDCCLKAGLMGEALLLAQCGDQDLWLKTQATFFEAQKSRHAFLSILHAIIKMELKEYVVDSDLAHWRETLAVIGTYGKSDEFPIMCEALALRLETEAQNPKAAVICYMCAANVARTVDFWCAELDQANATLGRLDRAALQRFVEKVNVFSHANPSPAGKKLNDAAAAHFSTYAALLATQGKLNEAPKYLEYAENIDQVLLDRLYHGGTKPPGSKPPTFPFQKTVVNACETAIPELQKEKLRVAAAALAAEKALSSNVATAVSASSFDQPAGMVSSGQAAAASTVVAPVKAQLPAGWQECFDQNSGRNYYINNASGMSQWDPPPMPTPIVTPTPAVHQDVPVNSMLRPGMTQAAVSVASTQSAASVLQPVHVQAGFNGMNLGGGVGISAHQVGAVNNTQFQQPVAAATTTTASAAATAQPVVQPIIESIPQVNSQSVTAFGEIIQRLMTCGSPAEKRQLTQISGNYDTLVSKVAANNVSADIMAKIDALVAAMNNRDFSTAKAIQSDLVSTAWTQHGSWVKGISGLLSILSKH